LECRWCALESAIISLRTCRKKKGTTGHYRHVTCHPLGLPLQEILCNPTANTRIADGRDKLNSASSAALSVGDQKGQYQQKVGHPLAATRKNRAAVRNQTSQPRDLISRLRKSGQHWVGSISYGHMSLFYVLLPEQASKLAVVETKMYSRSAPADRRAELGQRT